MTTAIPLATLLGHAADAVAAVRAGRSLNDALARCPVAARPGTQALAFHALRGLGAAEVVRRQLAPKTPPPFTDALLLTALALLWPSDAPPYPDYTLVDQAVAAIRARATASAGFVNAVLRRFLRERESLVAAALADPLARFNHPLWWLDRLRADWPSQWQAIADADNLHPPMTLRVNARRSTATAYVDQLAAAGIGARVLAAGAGGGDGDDLAPVAAVILDRPVPVTQLPGFADGVVSVQDAAAQLAAPLLLAEPRPGRMRVLEACAAPGGKSAHLLELADLDLLAIDRDPARLVRVDETLTRLGLVASTRAGDAAEPTIWWDGRLFDRILLDAPCSASGIVRRIPTCAGCVAPATSQPWPRPRHGCSMRSGRCSHRAGASSIARARCSVPKARTRSTLFCNDRPTPHVPGTRVRPGSCCRWPTITPCLRPPMLPARPMVFSSP